MVPVPGIYKPFSCFTCVLLSTGGTLSIDFLCPALNRALENSTTTTHGVILCHFCLATETTLPFLPSFVRHPATATTSLFKGETQLNSNRSFPRRRKRAFRQSEATNPPLPHPPTYCVLQKQPSSASSWIFLDEGTLTKYEEWEWPRFMDGKMSSSSASASVLG